MRACVFEHDDPGIGPCSQHALVPMGMGNEKGSLGNEGGMPRVGREALGRCDLAQALCQQFVH